VQKRGCHDYFREEKKRKLREAMFQGNTNDPYLLTCRSSTMSRRSRRSGASGTRLLNQSRPPMPLAHHCPLRAAGTATTEIFEGNMAELRANERFRSSRSSEDEDEDAELAGLPSLRYYVIFSP